MDDSVGTQFSKLQNIKFGVGTFTYESYDSYEYHVSVPADFPREHWLVKGRRYLFIFSIEFEMVLGTVGTYPSFIILLISQSWHENNFILLWRDSRLTHGL